MLQIYNSLTKKKEDFNPLHKHDVRIYSCGPTVYDKIHIGNLSAFITADTLRRILFHFGYKTQHVMNFTDVDDKTIKRSMIEYSDLPPKTALKKLTDTYTEVFLEDMRAIGNDVDSMSFISATKSIEGMRSLIQDLYNEGYAYIAEDGVYFSINKYIESGKTYGQLSVINSARASESRINNDEYDKDTAHDFALWKAKKGNEPSWPFELNNKNLEGRPGWHIECSVMSVQKLGQPFDIHTGGVDLKFPHHENEIAQSTAGKGSVYAKYFVHNEHLLVDGKKMSKSLNNFYTLSEVSEGDVDPLAFRLLVLGGHYRSTTDFSRDSLHVFNGKLKDIRNWVNLKFQNLVSSEYAKKCQKDFESIEKHLKNDMNTSEALAVLFQLIKNTETLGADSKTIGVLSEKIDALFGLKLNELTDIDKEEKDLLSNRKKAKENKDYESSDISREKLLVRGILVKDTIQGQVWQRI